MQCLLLALDLVEGKAPYSSIIFAVWGQSPNSLSVLELQWVFMSVATTTRMLESTVDVCIYRTVSASCSLLCVIVRVC